MNCWIKKQFKMIIIANNSFLYKRGNCVHIMEWICDCRRCSPCCCRQRLIIGCCTISFVLGDKFFLIFSVMTFGIEKMVGMDLWDPAIPIFKQEFIKCQKWCVVFLYLPPPHIPFQTRGAEKGVLCFHASSPL